MLGVVLAQVINGLVLGFLYIVIAEGLSIIFGMIGVVNFAHGAFFALGAYFAMTLRPVVGDAAILIVAPFIVGVAGMIVEATLLRPLYNKDPLLGLLLTFGLALFLQELIRTVWGRGWSSFRCAGSFFQGSSSTVRFWLPSTSGGARLCDSCLITVWLFLEKTPWGRIIRAGSRDAGNGEHAGHQSANHLHHHLWTRHCLGGPCRCARGALVERGAVDG